MRVRFGQMSDFAEAILREKPDLPVVRGDMPDTWIHGIGSMPIETQLAHTTRPRIAALESLDTLLGSVGRAAELRRAMPCAMPTRTRCCSANTPGARTWAEYAGYSYGEEWKKKLAAGDYRFLLEGFNQKRAYAHRAADAGRAGDRASGWPPWPRRSTCRAAGSSCSIRFPGHATARSTCLERRAVHAVTDVASGDVVPAAVEAGTAAVRGEEPAAAGLPDLSLPPAGADSRLGTVHGQSPPTAGAIENEFFRVTLDPARCGIRSIVDKRTGRELVNTQSPYALGQYLYERFDADQVPRFTRCLRDVARSRAR